MSGGQEQETRTAREVIAGYLAGPYAVENADAILAALDAAGWTVAKLEQVQGWRTDPVLSPPEECHVWGEDCDAVLPACAPLFRASRLSPEEGTEAMSEPELLAIRDPAAYWGQRALAAELACAEARADAERLLMLATDAYYLLRRAVIWVDKDTLVEPINEFLAGARAVLFTEDGILRAALSTPDTPGGPKK